MTSPYTQCEYISRNGVCGRRCYGGRCFSHRTRKSHTWCLKDCGRATQSRTGYCSHCGWSQNDHGHKLKRQEREMEAYVDEVLSWDWDQYRRASGGPPPLEEEPLN
jgi:hypothetical protein